MKKLLLIITTTILSSSAFAQYTEEEITKAWHSGKTLPSEVALKYAPKAVVPSNDNGFNVLVDVSHQCGFDYIWALPHELRKRGYRAIGSQASINTVLDPKGESRIRINFNPKEKIYPFAWYPNFEYNIIITYQGDINSPEYSQTECAALSDFVKQGGSLVIMGSPLRNPGNKEWSINRLLSKFGGNFTGVEVTKDGQKYSELTLENSWEVVGSSSIGTPVQARRKFGKGRVFITGSSRDIVLQKQSRTSTQEQIAKIVADNKVKSRFIDDTFKWLQGDQKPLGGKSQIVDGYGGGGAIYPELETAIDGFVVYYAPNLDPKLLKTVNEELPKITARIQQWLPSTPPVEPMYLIMSAGDGGGWAINAFRPVENGIISLSSFGLISVYAHELAHTMGGPANEKGVKAAYSPFDNQGEAHAGWFQGKINAIYNPELQNESNRSCQKYFSENFYKTLDLKRYSEDREYASTYGKGRDWHKIWVLWQKIDDVYGPTWYPRWKHIQYTRWADDPKRKLSWEESIEDMSIAIGEDLFPFFKAAGTSLTRDTMGEVEYLGKKINLPATRIDPAVAPGKIRIEEIGDWSKELIY